jgi:hypothetical protein
MGWNQMGWNPGVAASATNSPEPAQVWLPTPLPRHSRLLRIRFHPIERDNAMQTDHLKPDVFVEMVIPNPSYKGPAPASSAPAVPVTKATLFGDLTLTHLERQRLVGPKSGGIFMEFEMRRGGKPVAMLSFNWEGITVRARLFI